MGYRLTFEHVVFGGDGAEKGLETLAEGVSNILDAQDIIRRKGKRVSLGANVTHINLSDDHRDTFLDQVRRLMDEGIDVRCNTTPGPSVCLANILFDFGHQVPQGSPIHRVETNPKEPSVAASCNLDATEFYTEEGVEQFLGLFDRIVADNALYAAGAHTKHMKLGVHKRASDLRIIHELWMALRIGPEALRVRDGEAPDVTPAYRELGQATTSVYVINQQHSGFPILAQTIAEHGGGRVNFRTGKFPFHYAIPLLACDIEDNHLFRSYVPSRDQNLFYGTPPTEELEVQKVLKGLIEPSTGELAKIDKIRDPLLRTLQNNANVDRIAEFYDREDITLVRRTMLAELA